MPYNNESMGISAEVAIAKSFGIYVNPYYEDRSEPEIVELLMDDDKINKIFEKEKIPEPVWHVAEGQNPVDFELAGGKTLSVKTNQGELGKVAPQIIGQPTADTYFRHLRRYAKGFCLEDFLDENNIKMTNENKSEIFKRISINRPAMVVNMYWENLFDCDYYLHFFNLGSYADPLNNYLFLEKEQPPVWNNEKFSFTQSLKSWNESNTLKYCGVSMGEFQVHSNRNCFKFRFNMKGVMKLIKQGEITL